MFRAGFTLKLGMTWRTKCCRG